MIPRDTARNYAYSFRWAMLALWPPIDGYCTCPLGVDCHSPGKHPHPFSNSVKGATQDLDEIAGWTPDVNVGVALGAASNGVMVLDIDQPEVALRLLQDVEIQNQTAVATTGRGTHIYFHSTGPTNGFNLKDQHGQHLGEVRGDGQYVVAPPSMHPTGKQYEWSSLEQLLSTDDPKKFITGLLLSVDAEPKLADHDFVDVPTDTDIEQVPVPQALDTEKTDKILRGYAFGNIRPFPEDERSDFLYEQAMLIAEGYKHNDIAATAEDVASNTWWLHDRLGLGKFSGPKEFMRLGMKAVNKHDTSEGGVDADHADDHLDNDGLDMSTDEDAGPLVYAPRDGEYRFDDNDGNLYLWKTLGNARNPKAYEVCNFEPVLMTEYLVDDGDEQTRSWRVHLIQDEVEEPYEVLWHEEDRIPNRFGATLAKLPARFVIRPDMGKHIITATVLLAKDNYEEAYEYASTGWVPYGEDGHAYLLPGMEGAVHAGGIDSDLRIRTDLLSDESAPASSPEMEPYGVGVRPPVGKDEGERAIQALLDLIHCSDKSPGKTTAVLLQILAGPLVPSGAGETPPLMHVRGMTGAFKTSFSNAALSIFGTWIRDLTAPPTSWTGTAVFLQAMVHGARDLTLLIDDYKKQSVNDLQVTRMIQNYADRTSRGRGNTRGGITRSKRPRGLILSNGEDVWGSVASAEARTVEFVFGKGEIIRERLDVVQQNVMDGSIQLFGGAWLQWLAQNWDDVMEAKLVRTRRDAWRERLIETNEDTHMRVVTQVAVLGAVGDVLVDFVAETWPEHTTAVRDAVSAATAMLVGGVAERAELVREAAPFRQLAISINEALSAEEASLKPRGHNVESAAEQSIPAQLFKNVPVVGYHFIYGGEVFGKSKEEAPKWDEHERVVLLTEKTAFKFFLQQSRSTAVPAAFTWKAVVLDALQERGAIRAERVRVRLDATAKLSQLSGILVPLKQILEAHPDGEVTDEPHSSQSETVSEPPLTDSQSLFT